MTISKRAAGLVVVVALAVLVAACGSDDDDDSDAAPAGTTTTTEPEFLEILVTNDDGATFAGIDVVVEALRKEPYTRVRVVAPADNQTGQGGKLTEGELQASRTLTVSGFDATAVKGHPADTIVYALTKMGLKPHLVVSGANAGQNLGPIVNVSGTVGAAREAVKRGVPAVAVSAGFPEPFDYQTAADVVVMWVREHRAELLAGKAKVEVTGFNVPNCTTGENRGIVETPVADDFMDRSFVDVSNCLSTKPKSEIIDDMDALANGFVAKSVVPPAPPPAA